MKNASVKNLNNNNDGQQLVAIMKYFDGEEYLWKVFDKWDYADEVERFDAMHREKEKLEGKGTKVLWVKVLPIFDM